ncbi:MAG: hypothetical protein ACLGHQ_09670 [Acidimicrobiia bacterium]
MERTLSIGALLVVVASACSGGGSGPAAVEQTAALAPVQSADSDDDALGSELVGRAFDVRRDPG